MSQEPLVVPIHYDFASTLCYVTHRVMERLAPRFEPHAIEFAWTPIDLAALLNWKRGGRVDGPRLENVERILRELSVPAKIPRTWLDSRRVMAASLALGPGSKEAAWRERVFTGIYEEGRPCDTPGEMERFGRDLGVSFDAAALDAGLTELERRTRAASEQMVSGVPTFMLAEWPMGGIQDDDTMVSLLTRFAKRQRERATPNGDER